VVEERQALFRGELEVAEQSVREVGVRGQVGLAVRAEQPHLGNRAVVQRGDDVLDELEPDARASPGEAVCEPERHRADDVLGRCGSLADAVLEDQPPVELGEVAGLHARPLAHADAGRQPVDRRVARERAVDDLPPGANPACHRRGEIDVGATARDRGQVLEREGVAAERDRHGG